jgi:hypothetical protein
MQQFNVKNNYATTGSQSYNLAKNNKVGIK